LPDPQLENFFDTWVYSTGIPTLELKTSLSGKAPKLQLTVTVNQSGVGEGFGADVPVEIWLPGAKSPIVQWLRTSSGGASFKLPVRAAPARVELAPGNGILAIRK
jgi:aminopeptidase N